MHLIKNHERQNMLETFTTNRTLPLDRFRADFTTAWIKFIFNDVPADEVKHCPSVRLIPLRIVLKTRLDLQTD